MEPDPNNPAGREAVQKSIDNALAKADQVIELAKDKLGAEAQAALDLKIEYFRLAQRASNNEEWNEAIAAGKRFAAAIEELQPKVDQLSTTAKLINKVREV